MSSTADGEGSTSAGCTSRERLQSTQSCLPVAIERQTLLLKQICIDAGNPATIQSRVPHLAQLSDDQVAVASSTEYARDLLAWCFINATAKPKPGTHSLPSDTFCRRILSFQLPPPRQLISFTRERT
jgi:hypothetical protein